jgi:serine/threonine protein kinase
MFHPVTETLPARQRCRCRNVPCRSCHVYLADAPHSAGTRTGLTFSLNYAGPELLAAHANGRKTIDVDPSADIWSLGVVAYELLSLKRLFSPGTPEFEIRHMITGQLPLPWEAADPRHLRTLKYSVLQCLSRVPDERPTAAGVVAAWRNLLDFAAVKHTSVVA